MTGISARDNQAYGDLPVQLARNYWLFSDLAGGTIAPLVFTAADAYESCD